MQLAAISVQARTWRRGAPNGPAISATKKAKEMQMTAISFCLDVRLKRAMMLPGTDARASGFELTRFGWMVR